MGRINTSKMLSNNGYFTSVDFGENVSKQSLKPSPVIDEQYDFAMTEDIVQLLDRQETADILYKIWQDSTYRQQFKETSPGTNAPKIPKEHIQEIFYYMKGKLIEQKKISTQELVMAINEFFGFNYEYIVKKVLSPKMMAEIIEEYYNNGMKERIDVTVDEKLF